MGQITPSSPTDSAITEFLHTKKGRLRVATGSGGEKYIEHITRHKFDPRRAFDFLWQKMGCFGFGRTSIVKFFEQQPSLSGPQKQFLDELKIRCEKKFGESLSNEPDFLQNIRVQPR